MKRKCLVVVILSVLLCMVTVVAFAESWTCSQCGQSNTGNFCSNCGEKKPVTVSHSSSGLSDMRFEYQNNGDVLVTWTDSGNNGPYEVLYTIDGWEWNYYDEDNYKSCRALLPYLIPGETHTVKVTDSTGGKLSSEYTVPCPVFTEFKVGGKYLNMTETNFSISKMKQNPTDTFKLKVSWPQLKRTREYAYKLVLKTPLGYTSRVWKGEGYTFENRYLYRYWNIALMSEWLEQVKVDYNEIPIGEYTFEIYMDGQLYDYANFRVTD